MSDDIPSPLNNVITIDDERIKSHLDRVVRGTVEETLNALLDAEADRLCNAQRYERSAARRDTRAGHYERGGSVQNLSHFRLAERRPALAHAVMAPLICWSFSNSMFRYLLVDHAVPAMWRSLAAARLSAD